MTPYSNYDYATATNNGRNWKVWKESVENENVIGEQQITDTHVILRRHGLSVTAR
jgi:hypothetical protein